ncbi:uncharacterized protein LOC111335267 isoform X2 [Stylophora pistillata]|uniref:uncharacterized protein LOC111335267 isoform X2 n=1 Tax=Stylophora pistillata TaxID=50429 RepID=UPI000C05556E|nr:uncharacterized protein LOC111335267 isoform X2 [Stylophora pistillata]
MIIPAYTCSSSTALYLGRSYDAKTSTASSDVFQGQINPKQINQNKFSFKYELVKTGKQVNDLLDISGELSLKIKANLLTMEGAGKYITENKEEGTSYLLAVLKCTTIVETIDDGSVKVRDDIASGPLSCSVGTHYVKSVVYGGEMVTRLKFKTSSASTKENFSGKAEGQLNKALVVDPGLKASLGRLSSACSEVSEISIDYYDTAMPEKTPTSVSELIALIEQFPSRLKQIEGGKGTPVQYELQPITNIIPRPTAKTDPQGKVQAPDIQNMDSYFDDLRNAKALVEAYIEDEGGDDDDEGVVKFFEMVTDLYDKFREAIEALESSEGSKKVKGCLQEYKKAGEGLSTSSKLTRQWKKIMQKKVPVSRKGTPTMWVPVSSMRTQIKLPSGDPLTVVLIGKTGNGKSATGNFIVGEVGSFKESYQSSSQTKICALKERKEERHLTVIDTPGVLDSVPVSAFEKLKEFSGLYNKRQEEILREISRVFAMSPDGLDAILLVTRYGDKFLKEDAEALKILQTFFGKEAHAYMILILTHGDQAERNANIDQISVETHLNTYVQGLPSWVQGFLDEIGQRIVLVNNDLLRFKEKDPGHYKGKLYELVQVIDEMRRGKGPFMHKLTWASKQTLENEIKTAMEESGLASLERDLRKKEEQVEKERIEAHTKSSELKKNNETEEEKKKMEEKKKKMEDERKRLEGERKKLENEKKKLEEKLKDDQKKEAQKGEGGKATENVKKKSGGCYPGSATIIGVKGRLRRIESLQIGDEVEILTNKGIQLEPVITFIHRQPQVVEEFLKIVTVKEKILLITADHLLFVEVMGQATAIPARNVKIRDTVYVRGSHGSEKDSVRSISTVYEKGAYAPVTLSGTILVNDVHTSCYFDVLSHEWSHRAMGIARTVHYVSPSLVRRISAIGEKDGFPGWCRLAHTMLTLLD